ncbi:DotU family type IV/VI secretion system protein [Alphaproteobacteria bacterium KMM 3653]|uniref:DotU family type IV/VI secretion system protein n=1 Tax=Harenicola maris TaxID=2841044 RepID=A0AAP2CTD4_9RHOB|nr:DotU family type IV/VI secretion system protein [Harenicola maris]
MSDKKDGGKTVIRPMPGGPFGGGGSAGSPAPGGGGAKTVIGGNLPTGGWGGAGGGQPPQQPPQGGSGGWPGQGGGGSAAPSGGWGQPPSNQGAGGFGAPQDHSASQEWMGAKPQSDGFFPEVRKPEPVQRAPVKKISLDAALSAKTSGISADTNPIVAAAASLLVLFGRLRSQVVDMHAVPLMQHVTEEIEEFEKKVLEAGVDQQDAMVAKYCLCGTADDIVQNLPGTDRAVWLQYSMSARFFNKRTAGVGFFQEVDRALQNPSQKYYLLELMLICLQLGFEGQYRAMSGGDIQLSNVKKGIYEALRRVKPRGDDDISPRWKGIEIAARRSFSRFPVWAYALLASSVLAGAYLLMRFMLLGEGNALASEMRSIHPSGQIELIRSAGPPPEPPKPPVVLETTKAQLDRISEALSGEALTVSKKGDFIIIDVNNAVLFDSGKADVKEEFVNLAGKIVSVLNAEPGPVRIIGHTDNIPMSGKGKYKNNFELSFARAKSVAGVLSPLFQAPERVEVDGRGEDEPKSDNATAEGRAQNRRVEIMIQREDTL